MTIRSCVLALAALLACAAGPRPASAAEDCDIATKIVQQATDQVEDLKHRETSTRTQIEAASNSLSYLTVASLLESQLATHHALAAVWDIIAATTRAHPHCWPPGMAATVGSAAVGFAADSRRSIDRDTLMRDRAREAAGAQIGTRPP